MQIIKALKLSKVIYSCCRSAEHWTTTLYRKIKKYNLVRLIDIGEGGGKNHEN